MKNDVFISKTLDEASVNLVETSHSPISPRALGCLQCPASRKALTGNCRIQRPGAPGGSVPCRGRNVITGWSSLHPLLAIYFVFFVYFEIFYCPPTLLALQLRLPPVVVFLFCRGKATKRERKHERCFWEKMQLYVCLHAKLCFWGLYPFVNSVDGLKAEKGTQTRYILITLELEYYKYFWIYLFEIGRKHLRKMAVARLRPLMLPCRSMSVC